jgi:predicted nucleic acid-binding protein
MYETALHQKQGPLMHQKAHNQKLNPLMSKLKILELEEEMNPPQAKLKLPRQQQQQELLLLKEEKEQPKLKLEPLLLEVKNKILKI